MTSSPSESADPSTTPDESTTTPNYARRRAVIGITGVAALAVVGIGFAAATGWGAPADVVTVVQPTDSTAAGQATTSSSAAATPSASGTASESPTPTQSPTASAAPGAPTTKLPYDISTGSSVTVLVNKHYSLDPVDYAPKPTVKLTDIDVPSMNDHSLREDAAEAFKDMYEAALDDGITLDMTSGYRDYELQTELYNGYVEDLGQKGADLTSARPGSSEHQTGLAADISAPGESDCILTECFSETEASDWLVEHSYEYGYILRYPDGETDVTGYEYEPWHYRFIGVDAAAAYHESGAATYEEFLGVEPAPDYED
ncbi:M15 family metallopeptidase [Gulosibacter sp. ACHW.36C]|uniref:M15 family metallopeptidase n=1 Tax=Gulosibacter sediminis TaxID=1729695 RepID=A0ABY4MZT1_9MICO|nr:M15 family metallopeptidase [Gulosibacter sediminis]UQN14692.1 M15 family metallopeptidase [Gulosibacter sediminis]